MRRWFALGTAALALAAATLAPETQAQSPSELRIGSLAPNPSPWRSMLEQIETHIESGTGGAVNVVLTPPGIMGEVEMVRETRKGERMQGAGITTAALAEGGNIPILQIVELPYLFDDRAEADKVLDGVLWDAYGEAMRRRGFILGAWSENGFRSYGSKGKAIKSPADLAGMKMRSQESDVHMQTYESFGANAVQKPMTEVRTALQQGVVMGLDNSPVYILAGGLYDPLDYLALTEHCYQPAAIVYSRRWFEALPDAHQSVIREAKKFAVDGRRMIREEEKAALSTMEQLGLQVVPKSEIDTAAFKAKGRAMHKQFAAGIVGGTELLDKINTALGR